VDYQLYRMLGDALIGVVWMGLARCGGGAAGRKVSPFQLSFNGRLKVNFQGGRASLWTAARFWCESCLNAWAPARSLIEPHRVNA
jgi:hypothetical protein